MGLTYFYCLLAVANIAVLIALNYKRAYLFVEVIKSIRWRMLPEVIALLVVELFTFGFLIYYIPVLNWGLLSLVGQKANNIGIAPFFELVQNNPGAYILLGIFLVVFFLTLPFALWAEEWLFRRGAYSWPKIIKNSVKFGLFHLLVGVPITAIFPITLTGLFLGYKYRKSMDTTLGDGYQSQLISTAYHLLFDTILIVFMLVNFVQYLIIRS